MTDEQLDDLLCKISDASFEEIMSHGYVIHGVVKDIHVGSRKLLREFIASQTIPELREGLVNEWRGRALEAEKETELLKAEVGRLRGILESVLRTVEHDAVDGAKVAYIGTIVQEALVQAEKPQDTKGTAPFSVVHLTAQLGWQPKDYRQVESLDAEHFHKDGGCVGKVLFTWFTTGEGNHKVAFCDMCGIVFWKYGNWSRSKQ